MSKNLDIYKASAGSGKTFTLVHRYIEFLLGDNSINGPRGRQRNDAFRHILAVTFTNKATDEMKSRIVKTLYKLAAGNEKALADYLSVGDCAKLPGLAATDIAKVQQKSREALVAILHDYSNFQVSTIDKFFQQIFRAFARELGSFSNYRVEIHGDDVLSRVIDELLSSLDGDDSRAAAAFEVMNTFALNQLEYRSKTGFEADLLEYAKLFVKEDFKMRREEYNGDQEHITAVESQVRQVVSDFESGLKSLAAEALAAIAEQNLQIDDFTYGAKGAMGQVAKYAKGAVEAAGGRLRALAASSPEDWFSTKNAGKVPSGRAACSRAGKGLDKILQEIVALTGEGYRHYLSAKIVRDNIGATRVFGIIYDALMRYMHEHNIMLLGETADALHRMIDGSDTPFIYERVGSWLNNYLLDEFQDFSLMQWANFYPLLRDSLDRGCRNLIVGDVKQSIYRWRSSDWNTLNSTVEKEFPNDANIASLQQNWRSSRSIVDFNNNLFTALTSLENGCFDADEEICKIYSDCKQQCHSGQQGYVKLTYYARNKDEEQDYALQALPLEINELLEVGCRKSDIFVLVRKNSEAKLVADALVASGIGVVTEESLQIGSSAFVQRIVAVLNYFADSGDLLGAQILKELGLDASQMTLRGNSLLEQCESVAAALDQSLLEAQMPYVLAFMDQVLDYMRDWGSDLAGFVKWWQESGAKESITSPEGADAVRIMTIHKAKGLECEVAIVPFFYEELIPGSSSFRKKFLWCKDTLFGAGLLPVEFKKELSESEFDADYTREERYCRLDALNSAYVAFTRPKRELIVFAAREKDFKANRSAGVSDLVYDLLEKQFKTLARGKAYGAAAGACGPQDGCDETGGPLACGANEGRCEGAPEEKLMVYEAGSRTKYEPAAGERLKTCFRYENGVRTAHETAPAAEHQEPVKLALKGYRSIPISGEGSGGRLTLLCRGGDFFADAAGPSPRRRGIVLHDILSKISTAADIPAAVEDAALSGLLKADERESTIRLIEEMLAEAASYGWFGGEGDIVNELSIIDCDGTIHRPDRVVLCGGKATVVDYKFGSGGPSHVRQVKLYADLLSRMGYGDVEGYLWYAAEHRIEKVV